LGGIGLLVLLEGDFVARIAVVQVHVGVGEPVYMPGTEVKGPARRERVEKVQLYLHSMAVIRTEFRDAPDESGRALGDS